MRSRVALMFFACLCAVSANADVLADVGNEKFSWDSFGVAFAFLLSTGGLGTSLYAFCRWQLVLNPRVVTRRYSAAIVVLTTFYLVATVLENEVVGPDPTRLPYEAVPQALLLLILHFRAYKDRQPVSILLALSMTVATIMTGLAVMSLGLASVRLGQSFAGAATAVLIVYTLVKSTTTKSSYLKRRALSSYEDFSEPPDIPTPKHFLSLIQWVSLVIANVLAAVVAQVMEGDSMANLLAVDVLKYALILLGLTATAAFLAAGLYWLIRRKRLPDFAWIVWIIWSITSFAMLYALYLLKPHA